MTRRRITFYGRVQGVGFRWRAKYGARSLGITGWVRNNSDGTVTIEAQGSPASINSLIRLLADDDYISISGIESEDLPPDPSERAFSVAY